MEQTNNFREISVLIGVVAGFTFLATFFAGIGASAEKTFLLGVFFAVITVAITPLLFLAKTTKGKTK